MSPRTLIDAAAILTHDDEYPRLAEALAACDPDALACLGEGIAAERADHQARADARARELVPGEWTPAGVLSDESSAREMIREMEYDALEAAAQVRRVLAVAACIH